MAAEELDRYVLADRLFDLLAPELANEDLELVDVRVFRGGGRVQVRVYVDVPGEGRIDLEGCVRASRTAAMMLESADPVPGPYVLEVSSPGVRRPLRTAAHFAAAVGKTVELRVRSASGPPRRLRGRLDASDDAQLTIAPLIAAEDASAPRQYGPGEVVARTDVLEANLDDEFDAQALINADRRRRKEEKRQERQERRGQTHGRVRGKPQRET